MTRQYCVPFDNPGAVAVATALFRHASEMTVLERFQEEKRAELLLDYP